MKKRALVSDCGCVRAFTCVALEEREREAAVDERESMSEATEEEREGGGEEGVTLDASSAATEQAASSMCDGDGRMRGLKRAMADSSSCCCCCFSCCWEAPASRGHGGTGGQMRD